MNDFSNYIKPMNPEVKAQWVADLRSGKFLQGKGVLHRENTATDAASVHTFCCIGVLCESAVAAGVAERTQSSNDANCFKYSDPNDTEFGGNSHYAPGVVRVWAGLDSSNPSVEYAERFRTLADLNDDEGMSFDQIADLIEAQY